MTTFDEQKKSAECNQEVIKDIRIDLFGKKRTAKIITNQISNQAKPLDLDSNKLIIYFFLDKFKYECEGKIEFETEEYTLSYEFPYRNRWREFFYHFVYRLFALHVMILGDALPFKAIGLVKGSAISMNLIGNRYFDSFYLLYNKDLLSNLSNDFSLLDKKIIFNSEFEKAIIWHTLSCISTTNLETFMNRYRCLECLSKDLYPTSNFRHNTSKIKNCLKDLQADAKLTKNIIKNRNNIAHGDEFKLEVSITFWEASKELDILLSEYIVKRIKKLYIIGLKSKQFIPKYIVFQTPAKKKFLIVEEDDIDSVDKNKFNRLTDFLLFSERKLKEFIKDLAWTSKERKYLLYYYNYERSRYRKPIKELH